MERPPLAAGRIKHAEQCARASMFIHGMLSNPWAVAFKKAEYSRIPSVTQHNSGNPDQSTSTVREDLTKVNSVTQNCVKEAKDYSRCGFIEERAL